jgi:hypothetical protein
MALETTAGRCTMQEPFGWNYKPAEKTLLADFL